MTGWSEVEEYPARASRTNPVPGCGVGGSSGFRVRRGPRRRRLLRFIKEVARPIDQLMAPSVASDVVSEAANETVKVLFKSRGDEYNSEGLCFFEGYYFCFQRCFKDDEVNIDFGIAAMRGVELLAECQGSIRLFRAWFLQFLPLEVSSEDAGPKTWIAAKGASPKV
jgi:hypothetical protein